MFASLFRADSVDDRSPWGDFWFEPVTMRTASGARVSSDSAMRLTAVYRAVHLIAGTMASLPFCLYRKDAEGNRTEVTDHWLYRLIAKRPNDFQNPFEWMEMMQAHQELRGAGYNQIIANKRGEVTDLLPIHPDAIKAQRLVSGGYRYMIKQLDGTELPVARSEIFVVRGLSLNGMTALNPIEYAREALGVGLSAQDYAGRFFANDARPTAGWVELAASFKDDNARQVYRASLQKGMGGENRGKVAVFENGAKYNEPAAVNLKDMQFLETRQATIGDIGRIFGVPQHLLGDLTKSAFANIEQQSLEFTKYTMASRAERWEAALEYSLLPDDENLEVEFDFDNLERGDMKSRGEFYGSGILDGWLTRNEARQMEKRNKIDGLDEPLVPLNMVEEGEQPDSTDDAVSQQRADDMTEAAAARVLRKEIAAMRKVAPGPTAAAAVEQFYEKHIGFVREAMRCSESCARAWCATQVDDITGSTDLNATFAFMDNGAAHELAVLVASDVSTSRRQRRHEGKR